VKYTADCGTLVVSENRSNPNSRLIALPVIRIHSTGNHPTEPIFRLTGGPGRSNVSGSSVVPWLIENHDFVLVGYRGMDGTVRLDCPEVVDVMKGAGQGDMLSDKALDESSIAYARCAARLQNVGIDLSGYTVTELIDDIEAARVGLDYERINLISDSFGTNVASIYTYMYPESIYRSVMIAVDTPGATIHEPEVVDNLIRSYADLCTQDAKCSARTDDLAEMMRTVSKDMPARWLFFPINPGLVKAGTYNFFESTTEAPKIIDTWLAAAEGDPSGMAVFSLLGPNMFANASVWGHNAALRSSLGQFDPARDYRIDLNPHDSIMGSPASTAAYAEYTAWPATLIPEEYRKVQPSDVETLLVSGNLDSDTPVQFARDELLPSLSNGQHIILSEFGHGEFLALQPEASKHLLTSFYDTGVGDDSLFTYHPVDFYVGLGYPAMAKLGLAAIVLVVVALVVIVWFIVRKVHHRRAADIYS
jgi:pimeloyl-ACP methyl ester carboxylesterase